MHSIDTQDVENNIDRNQENKKRKISIDSKWVIIDLI